MKSDIPAIFNKSAIDKDLYRNIFHQNIQIEKYEMENLQLKPIRSFPVAHIRDFVLDQVKKLAIESPVQLVPASHFIDPDRLGIIADIDQQSRHGHRIVPKSHNILQLRHIIPQQTII